MQFQLGASFGELCSCQNAWHWHPWKSREQFELRNDFNCNWFVCKKFLYDVERIFLAKISQTWSERSWQMTIWGGRTGAPYYNSSVRHIIGMLSKFYIACISSDLVTVWPSGAYQFKFLRKCASLAMYRPRMHVLHSQAFRLRSAQCAVKSQWTCIQYKLLCSRGGMCMTACEHPTGE